jgi:crotonobetaine/carnitine-CoA ligase
MRRRGENVSSLELEQALVCHPNVAQVAAYPVPAAMGEDEIMVSLVVDDVELDPEGLFEYMREHLPYCAIPRYVLVRDSFPSTEAGKVLKRTMRDEGVTADTWDVEQLGLVVERGSRRSCRDPRG